jgi:hypothetical protein
MKSLVLVRDDALRDLAAVTGAVRLAPLRNSIQPPTLVIFPRCDPASGCGVSILSKSGYAGIKYRRWHEVTSMCFAVQRLERGIGGAARVQPGN